MYTGIVQAVAPILKLEQHAGYLSFVIDFPHKLTTHLQIGASVNLEGTCMSVTSIDGTEIGFDAMNATLDRTNLGQFRVGDSINVERSMRPSDENGGHNVAGHISTTAELLDVTTDGAQPKITFRVPKAWSKFIFERGFLAVNGCSLTVAEAADDIFTIYLIPETLRQTTFGTYRCGDHVNIEVDQETMVTVQVMERTLERLLPQYFERS